MKEIATIGLDTRVVPLSQVTEAWAEAPGTAARIVITP